MPDEYRLATDLAHRAQYVRSVVVDTRAEQRLVAVAAAVSAQRHRVHRMPALGEPGHEQRLPAPRVAIAAVDEQQRCAWLARGGTGEIDDFEVGKVALHDFARGTALRPRRASVLSQKFAR